MTPHLQTIFSSRDGSTKGNCLVACVASVLDLPSLDGIPHFIDAERAWFSVLHRFLVQHDCEMHGSFYFSQGDWNELLNRSHGIDGFFITCGRSPRGEWVTGGHAVIYRNGELAHDPHPSGDGILTIEYSLMIERKPS